ncbi:MAG: PAS domain-containing protein [Ginsengibacter sp.]
MVKKLKILYLLEDSSYDEAKVSRILNKAGIDFSFFLVNQLHEYQNALEKFSADLILAEHSTFEFDSFDALKIFKQTGLKIPFILITDNVSEEFAVNVLKEGADDYLLKTNLSRLPNAIENALEKRRLEVEREQFVSDIIASQSLLREAEELAKFGSFQIDLKTEHIQWSDGTYRIFGYKPNEGKLSYEFFIQHVHPEDVNEFASSLSYTINNLDSGEFLFRIIDKNQNIKYIESKIAIKRDKEGIPFLVTGVNKDITDRKKAEEKIASHEELIRLSQAMAHIGSWERDLKTDTLYWTDELYRIYSLEPQSEIISFQRLMQFIHPEDREKVKEVVKKCIENYQPYSVNFRIILEDGSEKFLLSTGEIVLNKNNQPVKMRGMAADVTMAKKSELQLLKLNKELEERASALTSSNTELEHFAYIASHDLQEPLRMVISFLQLLDKKLQANYDPQMNKYINYAVDGAMRMKIMIQDLLEFSRVGIKREFSQVDCNNVVNRIISVFKLTNENLKADFTVNNLPVINSSEHLIHQLFHNLIGNAVKYCNNNCAIEIGCTENNTTWQFYVKDNGIGIDPQFFDKIFVIFQRLHTKKEYSGTGIGLAICKKIVENLGGSIWVNSDLGKGSTFYFTIPKQIYETQKGNITD